MSGDQLTLLPAESLASLSVWPGSRQAQQMTVTSGRNLLASSRLCGPVGSALKTLVGSSAWRSTMCLLTWKPKVTPAGRLYYQLQVSVPRIEGSEFGLWPTPNTPNGGRAWPADAEIHGNSAYRPNGQKVQIHLHHLVEGKLLHTPTAKANQLAPSMRERTAGSWLLPTPRAEGFDAGAHRGKPDSLHAYVKMLPTPTVQDGKNNGAPSQHERNSLPLNAVVNGKLNPAWVSRMQGFPDGWMELE